MDPEGLRPAEKESDNMDTKNARRSFILIFPASFSTSCVHQEVLSSSFYQDEPRKGRVTTTYRGFSGKQSKCKAKRAARS